MTQTQAHSSASHGVENDEDDENDDNDGDDDSQHYTSKSHNLN